VASLAAGPSTLPRARQDLARTGRQPGSASPDPRVTHKGTAKRFSGCFNSVVLTTEWPAYLISGAMPSAGRASPDRLHPPQQSCRVPYTHPRTPRFDGDSASFHGWNRTATGRETGWLKSSTGGQQARSVRGVGRKTAAPIRSENRLPLHSRKPYRCSAAHRPSFHYTIPAAGLPAVYMTGAGTIAERGFPHGGRLTMNEMITNAPDIADPVQILVICDALPPSKKLSIWRTSRRHAPLPMPGSLPLIRIQASRPFR
jgi:hypothetical protein